MSDPSEQDPTGTEPGPPVAEFADPSPDLGPMVDDDAALRKMKGSSGTWVAIGATVLVVLGAAGFGVAYYQNQQAYAVRWDAYHAAQAESENQDEFLSRARGILAETAFTDVQLEILERVAHYQDGQSVPAVTELLRSPEAEVRTEAARTLAAIGSPDADSAKPTLMEVLSEADEEDGDRAAVVWALAVLGESSASDAIIDAFSTGHLQGQPGFDPRVISNVIGVQRLSSDELLNHEEDSVRLLTAQALAESGDPSVIGPLERLLDFEMARGEDKNEQVIQAGAAGLGKIANDAAAEPMFEIMQNDRHMRGAILETLRNTVGAPGVAALLPRAEEVELRRELVRILNRNRDPRAGDALAGELDSEDEDIKKLAIFGLAEIGDPRAIPGLIETSRSAVLDDARRALGLIQQIGVPEAAEGLMEMLEDEEYANRVSGLLRALGTTGNQDAGPAIMEHLDGNDQSAAALALGDLGYERAYDRLRDEIPRPPSVDFSIPTRANEDAYLDRTSAVRAIARYGRVDAAPDLMDVIEDPQDDRRLRLEAGYALGNVADSDTRREILRRIDDPEIDQVAIPYYIAALWQQPDPALSEELLDHIERSGSSEELRVSAALAVGYASNPNVEARVSSMLEAEATRTYAAIIIVLGGTGAQAERLLYHLGRDRGLADLLREEVMNRDNDRYNLLTEQMFESGGVYRRLGVARVLATGEGDNVHAYAWNQILGRLRSGWDGTHGVSAKEARLGLYAELTSTEDADRRELIAHALAAMGQRGMLMAARDAGGVGAEEARDVLRGLEQAGGD